MNNHEYLTFLLHGNQLKRTARTGWGQRGVPAAENVAAHSFGVIFVALALAEWVETPLDRYKVLAMAALHDLPESVTTDIPTPAWRYLPPGIKTEAERGAMHHILGELPLAGPFMALWEELHEQVTPEARLVDDADKLEMFIQAVMYEEQTGNRQLAEFWSRPHTFHFSQAQALYEVLRERRGS
ncbi:MAG: HD family hydrolase [Anaerolineae bacterium]|nr:HD family hydrolase [Anaerolineae bacterium]